MSTFRCVQWPAKKQMENTLHVKVPLTSALHISQEYVYITIRIATDYRAFISCYHFVDLPSFINHTKH